VQGAGCRVQGAGFRVQGSRFMVQGSGSRVEGLAVGMGSQYKNNCFAEMRIGSEAGSFLRLIDLCITQL